MIGGWTMPAYFFRSEPGAAELRRLARLESGRVCQRVLMIANLLEGMEHEEAARPLARSLQNLVSAFVFHWQFRFAPLLVQMSPERPELLCFAIRLFANDVNEWRRRCGHC